MKDIKTTKKQDQEIICESMKNMNYLEIYHMVNEMCESTVARNKAIEYLEKNHDRVLEDAMVYVGVIEE